MRRCGGLADKVTQLHVDFRDWCYADEDAWWEEGDEGDGKDEVEASVGTGHGAAKRA